MSEMTPRANPPALRGDQAARQGLKSTANPHAPDSRAYYEWHGDWHAGMAKKPVGPAQRNDPQRFMQLAEMYRRMGRDAGVL